MSTNSPSNTFIIVVIAIFIPPLAVAMHQGLTGKFWISLILTLLFFLPGLLYSLYVILGDG